MPDISLGSSFYNSEIYIYIFKYNYYKKFTESM